MKNIWGMGFIALLLVFVLTACGQEKTGEEKNATSMKVSFKAPDNIEAGKKMEYSVHIEKDGQPVKDADVVVQLEMAAMDHGKNGFRATMMEPGTYKGQAVLPMGGDWLAYVQIKAGGEDMTEQFAFKAKGDMMLPEEMDKVGLQEDGSLKNPDF
ncbi:FixH family protein [Aneurinibacillus sp. REN35]|uniref:FixH family protein n=1 Tax=Aneurinibacillus sp. REN35 TaxID=3237286 RepID=UPI0035276482